MANPPDIVQRITQRIQTFQRSQVQLAGPLNVVMPAARVGDIIHHTSFWAALAGAVVGACVTAGIFAVASAVVVASAMTAGLATPIAATVVGLGATRLLSEGIEKISNTVTNFVNEAIGGEPSGPIILGSPNVLVNNKSLAMANLPLSVGCTRHSPPLLIAQGSETVFVNGNPVARKGDKTGCSAVIAEGSPNVFFGSGQETYAKMASEFTGIQRALLFAVEFVVPPTALFSKGIFKAIKMAGKNIALKGAYVGAAIANKAKNIYRKSVYRTRNIKYINSLFKKELIKSANKLDKGNLTKAGRALQKHGSRANSVFPVVKGKISDINKQGELKVKEILNHPQTKLVERHHPRYGNILEYKSPMGGIRFNNNGENFIGFIEP